MSLADRSDSIDVAIIGAGWAGLSAASLLRAAGREPVVLEKSRGPGGRSATRRQGGFQFDHGAQYFTARSDAFRHQVEAWRDLGLVANWSPEIKVIGQRPDRAGSSPAERLVGVPGMNAVLHHMARSLDCRYGWQLARLDHDQLWQLTPASGQPLRARHLIITAPPEQVAALLGPDHPLSPAITAVSMAPCWALMLGFDTRLATDIDAAFVNREPFSWLARNSSKPDRSGETWVAHASAPWSAENLELETEAVAERLLEAFVELVPAAAGRRPALATAHRWRHSMALQPGHQGCLAFPAQALVVAGDWCSGSRIEGAWTSGQAAARQVLDQ